MKLERLALWDEKYLFTEQGETDKGFIGWLKGNFDEDRLVLSDMEMTGDNDYPHRKDRCLKHLRRELRRLPREQRAP